MSDHDLDHSLVGCKTKVIIYDNGWLTGTKTCFNTKMQKLFAVFEVGTNDYNSTDHTDGVEISLKSLIFHLS